MTFAGHSSNSWLKGPESIAEAQRAAIAKYRKVKADTATANDQVIAGLSENRRRIARSRGFAVFHQMCIDAGVQDDQLMDTYIAGASLVGVGPDEEEVAAQHRPPIR